MNTPFLMDDYLSVSLGDDLWDSSPLSD